MRLTDYHLIAPCGINCAVCYAYQRDKNTCPGCRGVDEGKMVSCLRCSIYNCEELKIKGRKYCFQCDKYPCRRMKQLDKRYRGKYGMSMIENLASIEKNGIRQHMKDEKEKWTCKKCGVILCVHREICPYCKEKRTIRKY